MRPKTAGYLTIGELATRLNVSIWSLYRAVHDGRLVATIERGRSRGMRVSEREAARFERDEFEMVR